MAAHSSAPPLYPPIPGNVPSEAAIYAPSAPPYGIVTPTAPLTLSPADEFRAVHHSGELLPCGDTAKAPPPTHFNDGEAANEHVRRLLPLSISEAELGTRYGAGIANYFSFVRFIIFTDLVLFLVSLGSLVPHYQRDHTPGRDWLADLFALSYTAANAKAWKASGIVQSLLSFAFPAGLWLARTYLRRPDTGNSTDVNDQNSIRENKYIGWGSRIARYFVSLIVLGGIVTAGYLITLTLQNLSNRWREQDSRKIIGIDLIRVLDWVISAAMTITNIICVMICYQLTEFERWPSHNKKWLANIGKVFVFRAVSVLAFFQAIYHSDPCSGSVKFFTLLVSDLVIGNLVEFFSPQLVALLKRRWTNKNALSDEANRPQFDLSEEYTELLHRQFLVYLGGAMFPPVAGMAGLMAVAEYWLDKYRLLRICQEPRVVNKSLLRPITALLVVAAVLGLMGSRFAPAFAYTLPLPLAINTSADGGFATGTGVLTDTCWARLGGAVATH